MSKILCDKWLMYDDLCFSAPMPSTRPQLLARILIVQNNQSIDSLFCVDDPCREMMGGNYSYRIPISQYFPEDSVIMKFMWVVCTWESFANEFFAYENNIPHSVTYFVLEIRPSDSYMHW